jgi:PPM family protein phosphatase
LVLGFDNLEHASLTDVGVRRSHNQDNHATLLAGDPDKWRTQGHLFLVADGMGAHAVGEKASEMAASIIPLAYHKQSQLGPLQALRKAFIEANTSIHARGQQNPEFAGMGTTGTALLLRPEGAWVGHVGDSRVYRIRDGLIEQLSYDHSLIWEFARRQKIDPSDVHNIPANVIVRSLGPEPLVQVDVEGPHPLRDGDIYVLCSDGLSGQVTDSELGAIASALPPAEACRFLVDLANLRGGPDNITVTIVRLGGSGAAVDGALASAPPRSVFRAVPWPLLTLFGGVLLAGTAIYLVTQTLNALAMPVFVVAALVLLVGMAGLYLEYRRQKQHSEEDDGDRPPPRAYRQAPCRIERPLLDKLTRAAQALKQRATEKNWAPDWNDYRQHEALAEKHLSRNDVPGAFREYCRAMRLLTETYHRHRTKEDPGPPVWDKNGE